MASLPCNELMLLVPGRCLLNCVDISFVPHCCVSKGHWERLFYTCNRLWYVRLVTLIKWHQQAPTFLLVLVRCLKCKMGLSWVVEISCCCGVHYQRPTAHPIHKDQQYMQVYLHAQCRQKLCLRSQWRGVLISRVLVCLVFLEISMVLVVLYGTCSSCCANAAQ